MEKKWYVLALGDTRSDLIQCTREGFEPVDIVPKPAGALGTQLHNKVRADVAAEGGRYVLEGANGQTDGSVPRATFTNNDVSSRGAMTEQHLTRVAEVVRERMAGGEAPLLVAMDPDRFALFQTVSGLPSLPERLDAAPRNATLGQLWQLSRDRMV